MLFSEAALAFDVDAANLEAALWAACAERCEAVGVDVVRAIALAIGNDLASQVEIPAALQKPATELIEAARFLAALADVNSGFAVREGRLPGGQELVDEARKQRLRLPPAAHELARAFVAQRVVC